MSENEETQITPISKARTPEEIGEFWDTHSLADYWDQTHEVEFEVRAQRRRRVTLDSEVYAELEAQAHARGLSPETLVNLWLAERLKHSGIEKIRIKVVPVPKSRLDLIPEAELAFYTQFGHVRNELLVIEKFLYWTTKNPGDGDVLSDVNVFQELILIRLLAGKVLEGWQLLNNKAYSDIYQSLQKTLDSKTRTTLTELEAYFSNKKNMIETIRNRFAFHYDPSLIRKQLSKVEETDQLAIYLAPKTVNCFYQFSEAIADSSMLNAVKAGDYKEATKKLSKEVMEITVKFIEFCDRCLDYMIETYLLPSANELKTRTVELDVLRKDQMTLPFFVE